MKPNPFSRIVPAAAILVVALAVAGCGSSKKSSTQSSAPATTSSTTSSTPAPAAGGGSSGLKVTADQGGALKFDTTSLTAKAGKVTITETNPSPVPHGIAFDGNGVDKAGPIGGTGSTSTVSATLKPGTYTFYCPVPGHKAAGMKGTLTVK